MPSGGFDPTGAESYSTVRRAHGGEKTPLGTVHRRSQQTVGGICALAVPIVIGLTLGVTACGVNETVFARVGSVDHDVVSLQNYLGAVTGSEWQGVDARTASRMMDQFLDQEVVIAAAHTLREVEIKDEPGARSAMVRSLLHEVCGPAPPVPDAVLQKEITERAADHRPARADVRQMLLDNQKQAALVRQRLMEGEEWITVSRQVSRTPNAEGGGKLGLLEQGNLPVELDDVIFSLAEGEISEPVEGPVGYHIFQVLKVVPEGPRSRAEVATKVARALDEQYARDFVRECVARLAREVGVDVYPDHLWFRYKGRFSEGTDDT